MIFLIVSAAVFLLLTSTGFFVTGLLLRRSLVATRREAVCGCKHHLSFHDDGGACHWTTMDTYADNTCGCQKFIPINNPTTALIERGERSLSQ